MDRAVQPHEAAYMAACMKKSGWLRRIVRVFVVRPLLSTPLTAEQVSSARHAIGVLAALTLAVGPAGFPAGATFVLIAVLLDRSGSELALAKGQISPPSRRHGFLGDGWSDALVFVGLGIGLRGSVHGLAAVGMGLLAGLAVVVVPWLMRWLETIDGRPSDEFGGVAGLDPDDALLVVPLALWVGWAEGLLPLVAACGPTFALAFFTTHYRKFSSTW